MKNLFSVSEQCKFTDIEIGEVFAFNACWCIFYKITDEKCILLDGTSANFQRCKKYRNLVGQVFTANSLCRFNFENIIGNIGNFGNESVYRLSEENQELYLTE